MSNTVATTIFAQLGGNRFLAMTGVKNLVNGGAYLQFDLPRGVSNKATKCRITLTDCDTYRVAFYKWDRKNFDMVLISEMDGIYFDQLREIFERETGFLTAL